MKPLSFTGIPNETHMSRFLRHQMPSVSHGKSQAQKWPMYAMHACDTRALMLDASAPPALIWVLIHGCADPILAHQQSPNRNPNFTLPSCQSQTHLTLTLRLPSITSYPTPRSPRLNRGGSKYPSMEVLGRKCYIYNCCWELMP